MYIEAFMTVCYFSVFLCFLRYGYKVAFGNGKGLSPSRCHVCARSNADWSLLWKRYQEKYITFYVDCMPWNWYWLSRQLCWFHREILRSWSVTSSDIASTCLYVSSHTSLSALIASLFCTLRILVVFGLGSGAYSAPCLCQGQCRLNSRFCETDTNGYTSHSVSIPCLEIDIAYLSN